MNFLVKNFAYFSAPKNGGSTIRHYIHIAQGKGTLSSGAYKKNKGGAPRGWIRHQLAAKKPRKGAHKAFCVYRDPEQRALSAYKDKVIRKKEAIKDLAGFVASVNAVLDARDRQASSPGEKPGEAIKKLGWSPYLIRHFMPQSYWWPAAADMDFVLDFGDWSAIRKIWSELLETELPDAHLRNSKALAHSPTIRMPREFDELLERIYSDERLYIRRAKNGGDHLALLESIRSSRESTGETNH